LPSALSSLWDGGFVVVAGLYSIAIVLVYAALHVYEYEGRKLLANCLVLTFVNGIGIATLMALLYIVRIMDFSRLTLLLFWLISSGLAVGKRVLVTVYIRRAHQRGQVLRRVVVIGSGSLAQHYIQSALSETGKGIAIEGTIGTAGCKDSILLGGYDRMEQILQEHPVDEAVIALEPEEAGRISQILQAAGREGIRITLVPLFSEYIPAAPTVRTVGGTAVINMRSTPLDQPGPAIIKRAVDMIGALLLIILFSPVMLAVAVGVRFSSPGPVIFRQERIGRNKKPFQMLKFRSMRINDTSETAWSAGGDARRTRFGRFIRRYSLDELPQLFNVLKGDMSLVGPRPEIPYHVERFKQNIPLYLVRQQIRPGMTGWAQVNGLRGDTSITSRVEYDIWYIENWSLWLDIKILLKTAFGGMVNPAESNKGA